ncbi:MAG: hypothetical protein HOP12_07815 [Candidatus Eisenbacteria bacterium]|uniref:Uncharacterized protein n=1 Tax=Eiseniibacteriota bacterium TaxID=2212470 RepID=A0A849SHY4_UNCEI|nr:hypothetical protein [Candidatus Eisenbacteria bacterium]
MQKLLVAALAATLLTAAAAHAAVPGSNLGWTNCGITPTSENRVFACDDNAATFNLVGSFRVANAIADFVAVSGALDIRVNDAGTPAWWSFSTGGCREGAMAASSVGTLGGCTNPYSGSNQLGALVIEPSSLGPNYQRIRVDQIRDTPFALTANTLYSAFMLQINSSGSFDEGFGGVCAGCATAACFVLNSLEVFSNADPSITFESADVRSWATYNGGQVGADICPIGTPTHNRTWGQIKALYR